MADAPMTTNSFRGKDRALRVAQAVCVSAIAILFIAGASGYEGVILGGVLLFLCLATGIAAYLSLINKLSKQQRALFKWIALGAAFGAVAKISWMLHFVSNGERPSFPALADYLLLGAEIALVVGFVRMLYVRRAEMRIEAFVDLILVTVAAGVILLPLVTAPIGGTLGSLATEGRVVGILAILAAAASLVLLALLITWRGEDLSRRAMLGLVVGTVATAVFTAWAAQLALSGAPPMQVPMDVLAGAAILGFVSALDIRRSLPTLELKIAERTAALSGTVEELKGVITEERAMRAQIIERERLASIGSIVGGVAHEINNPLSSISAFAQLVLDDDDLSDSQRESLEAIYSEAMRAANVIRDLRAFARRSASESRAVDLNEIIGRTVRLRSYQMDSGNVRVQTKLDMNLPMVTGDPQQLQQVVVNLMSNGISSMQEGGELIIASCAEEGRVIVEFIDSGPGIPVGLREKIFDPFLAAPGFGEGVGMGLSVSYGIVAAHGGSLRLADGSEGKTKFVVELPAARWQPESAGGEESPLLLEASPPVPGTTTPSS